MRERAFTFGEDNALVGILCQPLAAPGDGSPGFVLLNAGLLHRVGPARLNVDLARRLAANGFASLRFDLAGLGDSEPRRDQRNETERAVADIRDAMDFMQSRLELSRFVLLGLCSGADNAHFAAMSDERVVGTVLLDPYGYRTLGYYARHYGPRMLKLAPWVRFARRALSSRAQSVLRLLRGEPEAPEMFERTFPERAQVAADLERLSARGVDQLLVYTGGVREHYFNHRDQFGEMFPALRGSERIEVEYFDQADHVYTIIADREQLMDRICRWTRRWSRG